MKVVNCTKCNEEYAIDLNKPEEWYCPYCDNLYSITTDKLSVEKLEPIGYYNEAHGFLHDEFDKDCYCQGGCSMEAVYTESQVKKLTDENKVEKLQEQLNTAKKALTEIYTQPEDDEIISIEEYPSQIRYYAKQALAAIGGDDE